MVVFFCGGFLTKLDLPKVYGVQSNKMASLDELKEGYFSIILIYRCFEKCYLNTFTVVPMS